MIDLTIHLSSPALTIEVHEAPENPRIARYEQVIADAIKARTDDLDEPATVPEVARINAIDFLETLDVPPEGLFVDAGPDSSLGVFWSQNLEGFYLDFLPEGFVSVFVRMGFPTQPPDDSFAAQYATSKVRIRDAVRKALPSLRRYELVPAMRVVTAVDVSRMPILNSLIN